MSTLNWRRLLFALFLTVLVALGILLLSPAWLSLGLVGVLALIAIAFYYVTALLDHATKVYFHSPPAKDKERPTIDTARYYNIVSRLSDSKCLDVPGGKIEDKTPIELYTLHDGQNQQWMLVPGNDGYFYIVSRLSNSKCLDVPGGNIEDKTPIELYSLQNGQNQQWKLIPSSGTDSWERR